MTGDIIVRKNILSLSDREKKDFIDALLALKANTKDAEPADNRYDYYVLIHAKTMATAAGTDIKYSMRNLAHRGPIFLPWHREFLRRFELELRQEVPTVSIPYWDWTDTRTWNWKANEFPWTDDFMGGNGNPDNHDIVRSGPFKNWIAVLADQHTGEPVGKSGLMRTLGQEVQKLPTQVDVCNAFSFEFYDTPYWDTYSKGFRNALEGWTNGPQLHNRVHAWVGGTMEFSTSPNDPLFFLNHCNVDRLWAHWQDIRSDNGYAIDENMIDRKCVPIRGYNLNDKMKPWENDGTTIMNVLDHRKLEYIYDK